jgi:hypothetical protein
MAQQAFGKVGAAGVAGAEDEDERFRRSHGENGSGMSNEEFRMAKLAGCWVNWGLGIHSAFIILVSSFAALAAL